eukprot:gene10340-12695_t
MNVVSPQQQQNTPQQQQNTPTQQQPPQVQSKFKAQQDVENIDEILNDLQLFPMVLELISRAKDEELDVSRAANQLNEKVYKCVRTINTLPGITRTLEEQEALLKSYKDRLKKKKELLEKLRNIELFKNYCKDKDIATTTTTTSENQDNDQVFTNTDNTTESMIE